MLQGSRVSGFAVTPRSSDPALRVGEGATPHPADATNHSEVYPVSRSQFRQETAGEARRIRGEGTRDSQQLIMDCLSCSLPAESPGAMQITESITN
jgi:hypothetical protein